MKNAKIDLSTIMNEDFPLQVQCENRNFGQPPVKAVIIKAPNEVCDRITDGFFYAGWTLEEIVTMGAWNSAGRGSACMCTPSIIKIGWDPDFDWSKLPEAVRFIGKPKPYTDIVIISDSRLTYRNNTWVNPIGSDYAMPAHWLGLEDWEGGPEAILERP